MSRLDLQISGDDPDDYKKTLKGSLKRVLEGDKDAAGGATEFVIAYVQVTNQDSSSNFLRSSKKVELQAAYLSPRHGFALKDLILTQGPGLARDA